MPIIKLEGLNSIYDEPQISSTIKENPFAANVELEGKGKGRKGEVVLRPDGEALHDVVGKRHYAGGVETWLPEGSFVFSDFRDLAFNKRDHELFELKEGGSYRKDKNTPAEVLRRNIDVKHYNKMSETLGNKYKDNISKNTAELMLGKYQEKLGQIALLQESKKGFPEGTPSFSQGTAPVYEDEFKEDIMEQKQYMKFGGNILPKFQKGVNNFTNKEGVKISILPDGTRTEIFPDGTKQTHYVNGKTAIQYPTGERYIGNSNNFGNTKRRLNPYATNQSTSTQGRISGFDPEGNERGISTPTPQNSNIPVPTNYKTGLPNWDFGTQSKSTLPVSTPGKEIWHQEQEMPSEIQAGNPSPVEIPWQFTPWQKYSMGLGFKNYAGINRLMPMRSQINSPLVELERMAEPSYLGELASGFRANQVMNPYLAGANNAQMYGQMLNAVRSSSAGNINANAQIANQQNLMNNQIQRQDLQTNIGADQQYYNQVQQSKGNFDNLRSAVREQNRAELMGNVQQNEQLAMMMARLGKDRPFDYNFRTGQVWHTGRGDIMSQQSKQGNDIMQKIFGAIEKKGIDNLDIKSLIDLGTLLSRKGFVDNMNNIGQRKMGGYNPYRR